MTARISFDGATFSGGVVSFEGAKIYNGEVTFDGAKFDEGASLSFEGVTTVRPPLDRKCSGGSNGEAL